MQGARRLDVVAPSFGLEAARRLIAEKTAPWIRHLGLLVESVDAVRSPGAPADWQPGAVLRLPFMQWNCRDGGVVSAPALTALADTAMAVACAAACNTYMPMAPIDQTIHFIRPVNFDVIADARVVRIGRTTSFGRVTLHDVGKRPVGMVSCAYAIL